MDASRLNAHRPAGGETRTARSDTGAGRASAGGADGLLGAADFSQLLSGLNAAPVAEEAATPSLETLASAVEAMAGGVLDGLNPDVPTPLSESQTALPSGTEAPWMDLSSLVGQTQRMDQAADRAQRDGTYVPADGASVPGMRARPMGATWQTTQVAQQAQTVWSADAATAGAPEVSAHGHAHGHTALADAMAETGNTAKTEAAGHSSGGRFAVAAGMEAVSAPALQAVLGQVSNWAESALGAPRRTEAGAEGRSVDVGAVADQGGGSESLAPQDLADVVPFEAMVAEEPPVEDMNYWFNARTQRADLVLDRDGQPVRVQVTVTGNEAQVHFSSDQVQTRELLDSSLAQLRDLLSQQGLVLTGASVQSDASGQGQAGGQQAPQDSSGLRQARIQVSDPVAGLAGHRTAAGGLDVFA